MTTNIRRSGFTVISLRIVRTVLTGIAYAVRLFVPELLRLPSKTFISINARYRNAIIIITGRDRVTSKRLRTVRSVTIILKRFRKGE